MAKNQAQVLFEGGPATISIKQYGEGVAIEMERPCQSEEEMDETLALFKRYVEEARKIPGWKTEYNRTKTPDPDEEDLRKHVAAKTRASRRRKGS